MVPSLRRLIACAAFLPWPALGAQDAPTPRDSAAPGASGPPLTLHDAVDRALRLHPSIGAATAATDEARATARQAAAARRPSLMLSGSANRYEYPMVVTPIHGLTPGALPPFDRTLYQGAATLSYTLFDAGARDARLRRARAGTDAATADADVAAQSLIARVASTYAQVLARQRVAAAHAQRIAALELERRDAKQRLDAGRAARLELLRAEAALDAARADAVHATQALDLAERDLAQLTGAPVDDARAARLAAIPSGDAPLPARDELVAAARAHSPALRRAERQAAAARAGVDAARAARLPRVDLAGSWIERGSAGTQSWGEWNVGAALSLPVYTGGATTAEVARARAAERQATERLHLTALQLEQEVDRARAAALEAHARATALASAATGFEEVARIQRLALDAGSATQADYLDAEADLLAARASLAEAHVNAFAARVELARVAGELSPAWLTAQEHAP